MICSYWFGYYVYIVQDRIETNHGKTNVIGATRFSVFTIRFTVRHLLAVPLTLALAYSLRYSSFSPAYLHSLAFFRMFSSYRSNGGLTLFAENSNVQLSLFGERSRHVRRMRCCYWMLPRFARKWRIKLHFLPETK